MTAYAYDKATYNSDQLHAELAALFPSFTGLNVSDGRVEALFVSELTASEQQALASAIQAHSGAPKTIKGLLELVNELTAFVGVPDAQPLWVKRLAKVACISAAAALIRDPKLARRAGEALDGDK